MPEFKEVCLKKIFQRFIYLLWLLVILHFSCFVLDDLKTYNFFIWKMYISLINYFILRSFVHSGLFSVVQKYFLVIKNVNKRNLPLTKRNVNWADKFVCITIIILLVGIKRTTEDSQHEEPKYTTK